VDRLLHADGKVLTPLFRAKPGATRVDRETGETIPLRHEPDAALHFEGDGEAAWGTKFVMVAARGADERTRVILDLERVEKPGAEASVAMECFRRLAPLVPGAQGIVYDTALRGIHHQELLRDLGLLPVNRVTAAEKGVRAPAAGVRRRHYWKGSLVWDLSDAFLDAFTERGTLGDGACGVEIFSLGGAISDVSDDATAYPSRGAVFDSLAESTWEDPRDDQRNISITRANWEALSAFVRGGAYVNDLGTDAQDRVREVYGSKFERLVALKRRWDPDNTFHRNANIPPILG